MSWIAPVTFVSGTVCTAGNLNILSGDMALLPNSLQFVAQGGGISGAPPGTGAPNFQIQAGVAIGTTTSGGVLTVTFPVPFPAGLIAAWAINYSTVNHGWIELTGSPTRTAVQFIFLINSTTVLNAGSYDVPWIAVGF